jgi:acetylornithine deacetylase/succinyl-diaminopimelate desuccinylase-like protein
MSRRARVIATAVVSLASAAALGAALLHAQQTDRKAIDEEATKLLQQYIRIDSSNPPGNTRPAADFLEGVLARDKIGVVRFESSPGKSILLARLKATVDPPAGKAIVLLHHMDVVPADRAKWKLDPFAGVIQRGALWGRGAFDMKGPAVAQLIAFLMLKRLRVPLGRDVVFLANPDEEVGGDLGARWMIANHYRELDPEYVIDEGGFGSADLFANGKLVYGVAVAEKKMVWLRVRAEGVAGHGSQPTDQNPNDRLVRALARLLADQPSGPAGSTLAAGVTSEMDRRVGTFASNKFTNAIRHSTIAVTTLRSGIGEPPKVNVIPSTAEATLDCRVLPGTTRDQWIAEITRRLADPGLTVELINESDDPVVSSSDTPLYRNLEGAIRRRHADAVITPMLIPYGTDGNAFRPKGVKTYGIFPGIVSAEVVTAMHGDQEYVPLAAVHEAAQILFETLRETLAPK